MTSRPLWQRWYILLVFFASLAFATGEGDQILIQQLGNDLFPPVSSVQHQLAAVQGAQDQLQRLGNDLLYAALSASDLQIYLAAAIKEGARTLGIAGDDTGVRIELRDQEAVLWITFQLRLPELPVQVAGEAEVHCAAAVERGALVLRPSVSTLRLDRLDGETNLETLKPFLDAALRNYLNQINSAIGVQRIPLRLQAIEKIDAAALLKGIESVGNVQAQPVDVNIGLGAASLLVDADGIHILADAAVLTPERLATTLEELSQDLERSRVPQLTSNQLAVLGECGRPVALPEPLTKSFLAVCDAFTSLSQAVVPTLPIPPVLAEALLRGAVQTLGRDFRARVDLIEPLGNVHWDRTVFLLSRSQLAAGLNELLPGVVVQAGLRPPNVQAEIPPESRTIRTPPTTNLGCDQVGGACTSEFEYPVYNSRGCPSDCDWWDLGCQGWKIDCERLKQQEKTAYEAAKAAAQAAWFAEKTSCEAAKAAQKAGCQFNQAWLDTLANLDVGDLSGSVELRDIELALGLDQVHLGADFESLDLRFSAAGGAEVAGDFTFAPRGAGNLVCQAQWNAILTTRAELPVQRRIVQLQRIGVASRAEGLFLTYRIPEVPLQLKFDPPPVKAFLEQNLGKLALSCPLPAALAATVPGGFLVFSLALGQEILRDVYEVKIPPRELRVSIPAQEVRISSSQTLRIVPAWGEKAIVLEMR